MFRTRLNPTKPPAAHRAVLEHVGAACRELRAAAEAGQIQAHDVDQVRPFFGRHGVFRVGVPAELGGAGDDPLLVALTAERIGRDGPTALGALLSHLPAAVTVAMRGTQEQKEHHLRAAAAGTALSLRELVATADESKAQSDASGLGGGQTLPISAILMFRLALAAGRVGMLADCIEVLADITATKVRQQDVVAGTSPVAHFFAESAADLEAGRAITYAAAELKAEFDRRSTNEHLTLEATTLVSEACLFTERAIERMRTRAAETPLDDARRMLDYVPRRHDLARPVERDPAERLESLENAIARFYLFL